MTSERSGDIYLTLIRIVILNRCHHLLKEQISSVPCPQAGSVDHDTPIREQISLSDTLRFMCGSGLAL